MFLFFFFFFFKQKTAYEMRISDWSSDVCSSDLNTGNIPTIYALVILFCSKFATRLRAIPLTMPCRWSKEPDCVPAYSLHRSPRHGRRDLLAAPGRRLGLLLAADGGLPRLPHSCAAALPLRAHRQPGDHGAARPYGGEPPAPSHCARHGHACRGRAPGRLASALPQRTATRPNGGPASRHFGVTSLCPAAIVHAMFLRFLPALLTLLAAAGATAAPAKLHADHPQIGRAHV